jgi:hypothetical protein
MDIDTPLVSVLHLPMTAVPWPGCQRQSRAHTTRTNKPLSVRPQAVSLRAPPCPAKERRRAGRHISQRPTYLTPPLPLTSPTVRTHQTVDTRPRVPGLSYAGRKEKLARHGGANPISRGGWGNSHVGRRSRIRRLARRRQVDRRGRAAPQRL